MVELQTCPSFCGCFPGPRGQGFLSFLPTAVTAQHFGSYSRLLGLWKWYKMTHWHGPADQLCRECPEHRPGTWRESL